MFIADFLPAKADRSWDLARQAGVTHAVCKWASDLTGLGHPSEKSVLQAIQFGFAARGIELLGLEGDPFDMQRIKLGLPGRDEDISAYQSMLRAMGELGLRLLCYNFMASIGWYRTETSVPIRGGARSSRFQSSKVAGPLPENQRVTAEQLWANYQYFLSAVLPVAEEYGIKLGLHPDDPPIPELRGVGRIFGTVAGFERAMALSSSPSHRITFCQANFRLMDRNLEATARRLADRIVYVHFRDVDGTATDFVETFHDDGPTDMPRMIRLYQQLGFSGPIRVDHVPTMAGEDAAAHGYALLGRLFAVGYLKGILDSLPRATP